jgi:hypothetical protein
VRWKFHVAHTEEVKNIHSKTLVDKRELGQPGPKREDNIKMCLKRIL